MFNIKTITIKRDYGVRPQGKSHLDNDNIWDVEVGEPYALVRFVFEEVPGYYYWTSVSMNNDLSDEEIERQIKEAVKTIPESDLDWFKRFIENGERWGWD